MEISVRQTSIKPKLVRHLLTNGIVLVSHLSRFDTVRLAQKTKLSIDDCEQILDATKPKRPHYVMKVSEFMIAPFDRISTLNEGMDRILGGGIKCGHITEISGDAGSGKSNLCSQIGMLVMLPKESEGHDGHVLMIHTEGEGKLTLAIKRFTTIADSINQRGLIRDRLHVMNCANQIELAECANRLPSVLEEMPAVKLVIIDSITCAFMSVDEKLNFDFYNRRSLTLTKIVKTLCQLAWDKRLAILATNHASYNMKLGENRPAMGKTWSHMCQTRIFLERKGDRRFAQITKGAVNDPAPVEYVISSEFGHSI